MGRSRSGLKGGCGGQHIFRSAVLPDPLGGGFGAHARHSGKIVGSISRQGEKFGDFSCRHAPFGFHFRRAEQNKPLRLRLVDSASLIHKNH